MGEIYLNLGCGSSKPQGFTGLDKYPLPGVDIVHDMEVFPWPLADDSCYSIVGSHIIEHIKPWLTIDMFNEMWRVMKGEGQLTLMTPYAGSSQFWNDPTHINGFTEKTFEYFDPQYAFYQVYKPRPWKIFNLENVDNILRVQMDKRK